MLDVFPTARALPMFSVGVRRRRHLKDDGNDTIRPPKVNPENKKITLRQENANVPQDEENGIVSGRGELTILPTVEEIRPHREGISPATAAEEKTAADTQGQDDQTSRKTLNPLYRIFFPRGQVGN